MKQTVKCYGIDGEYQYLEVEIPEEPIPEPEPEATLDERVTALEDAIATGLSL